MKKTPKPNVTKAESVKNFRSNIGHQFCIDAFLVGEVLKAIPRGVNILAAEIEIGTTLGSRRIAVPNALRKYGLRMLHETKPNKRGFLFFNQTNKDSVLANTRKACEGLGVDFGKAQFVSVLLEKSGDTGLFRRTTKEIRPYENDQRRKLKVLGLTQGQGKVMDLVAALGAKKYYCEYKEVVTRTAICKPEE